jgi:hypothetical protein
MAVVPAPGLSSPVVAALEAAWSAIRRRHPDVPAAVVVVASGTDGRPGKARWGHFAALRWVRGEEQLPEVLIAGEGLAREAEEVLATLLHEAAHGVAHVRQVADTSRQARYHNRRFRALAEEMGLEVGEPHPVYGFTATTLPEATARRYARELEQLRRAFTLYRRREARVTATRGGRASSNNGVACVCACPRRIRVARAVLELGPIVCGVCEEAFEPGQVDEG